MRANPSQGLVEVVGEVGTRADAQGHVMSHREYTMLQIVRVFEASLIEQVVGVNGGPLALEPHSCLEGVMHTDHVLEGG